MTETNGIFLILSTLPDKDFIASCCNMHVKTHFNPARHPSLELAVACTNRFLRSQLAGELVHNQVFHSVLFHIHKVCELMLASLQKVQPP